MVVIPSRMVHDKITTVVILSRDRNVKLRTY